MSGALPTQLLDHYEEQVTRCACGSWVLGSLPCGACVDLALLLLNARHPGRWVKLQPSETLVRT